MRRKPNHPKNNNRRRGGGFRGDNSGARIKSVTANRDKYLNLSRDALASGERIESEYYLQHAEHYSRVLATLQEDDNRARAEQQRSENTANADDGDKENVGNVAEKKDEASDSELAQAC